ncbi:hypothetical protein CXB51_025076 [Gossypium anomalum]|uniref:Uncharacterized protein n=1 Tax=Gossypium anomalum TaxID=47600 RepID=A0A8J6CS52_9ROSI|nr:hypothetical protein CXB51_025076 [Gossypium anomalum]
MGFYDYAHSCFLTSNPQHPPSIFTEIATIKVIIVSCMWQNNNPKSLCPACYNVTNPKYDTCETYKQGFILSFYELCLSIYGVVASCKNVMAVRVMGLVFLVEVEKKLLSENEILKSRSRAVSTERTILSPFTKEYRVLAAYSGIRLFLEAYFLFWNGPSSSSLKYSFDSDPLLAANTASLLEISDNIFIYRPVPSTVITVLNKLLIMYHSCFQSSISTTNLFVCPWSRHTYMVMNDLMARQTYVHNFWYHFPQLVQNPELVWEWMRGMKLLSLQSQTVPTAVFLRKEET